MKSRKIVVWNVVFILFFAITLSACSSSKPAASGATPAPSNQATGAATSANKSGPNMKIGYASSANSLPVALTPENVKNVNLEAVKFTNGTDVLTALVSKSIDFGQVTYLTYITALDKGFDVVAISGEVNGGSELILAPGIDVKADDWEGLKAVIADYKKQNKQFVIGNSRGTAQDIELRGELVQHGIDPIKDVQITNIPNQADHEAALKRGEVQMLSTVEPFASQMRLNNSGKHFTYPYDTAAGNLVNLVITRKDVINDHPKEVEETVASIVKVVDSITTDKSPWLQVIKKLTSLDDKVGAEAVKNGYPDYKMYHKQTLAIVGMMKDLKYITNDVTDKADKNMDYTFLSKVTGKPKEQLGYN
jgi:ABC-type nitrate/sulfonate/bicarbonate transport system substrate-binding protein